MQSESKSVGLRAVLLLGLLSIASSVLAGPEDDIVRWSLTRQHVPGAWVVVLRDGNVLKAKGYGIANLEHDVPVTLETRMQSGSIGKMFTAAGILALVEQGKLNLTDSLASFFDNSPAWWKPITIRHMLTHTGGIPEYEGSKYSLDERHDYSESELLAFAQKMEPDFAPGEKFNYSNTDYMLLGILIHKLSGKPFAEFLRETIWKPAKMLTIRPLSDTEIIPHRSGGYNWENGKWQNDEWVAPTLNATADGTLYVTADDMIQWDRALNTNTVLSRAALYEMWTPTRLRDGTQTNYGYGWTMGNILGQPWVGHTGAWQGFVSFYIRFQNGLSVAVFCNCSSGDPRQIALDVAGVYDSRISLAHRTPIPDPLNTIPDARQIFKDLAAGKQPTLKVGSGFLSATAEDVEFQRDRIAQAGGLLDVELVYSRASGKKTVLTYRLRCKEHSLGRTLIRDENGNYSPGGG